MTDKIDFVVVNRFDYKLLSSAAYLHIEHLSYRSFITLFGQKFMMELYKDILSENLGFFVFALDGNKVIGFVLGCKDSNQLFNIIKRKTFKYFKIISSQIIKKPKMILKLFETLFYVKKENSNIKSELIVIVTDSNYRDKRIGSHLVSLLNKEFIKKDIHQYKVTVHDDMEKSNNFYIKNGMKLSSSFMMYKVKWNLYVNEI